MIEISREEAELIIDAIDAVHSEGVGFGDKEKDYLELIQKIDKEFPGLVEAEVYEGFG